MISFEERKTSLSHWFKNTNKIKLGLITAPAFFLALVFLSVSNSLLAPGTDPLSARLAEWGRDHYLGAFVSTLENVQYNFNKPKLGGALDPNAIKLLSQDATPMAKTLPTIVTPALPGEGDLKTVFKVNGKPAIQVGYLRPDVNHTSYLAGIAIMNSSLLRFVQHPGFLEPGHLSTLAHKDLLKGADLTGLAATFNSAFKIKDSLGGYYQDGKMIRPLVAGKASLVIYDDGHLDIGAWGSDLSMTSHVVSVRQNLSMLMSNSVVTPNLGKSVLVKWGATVKNAYFVWRSGLGINAQGNVIYVAGNSLSVQSLANLLKKAGAVRAMELDINQDWISYMWYPPNALASTTNSVGPIKLVAFTRSAKRYLSPSSRDFFAVYAK